MKWKEMVNVSGNLVKATGKFLTLSVSISFFRNLTARELSYLLRVCVWRSNVALIFFQPIPKLKSGNGNQREMNTLNTHAHALNHPSTYVHIERETARQTNVRMYAFTKRFNRCASLNRWQTGGRATAPSKTDKKRERKKWKKSSYSRSKKQKHYDQALNTCADLYASFLSFSLPHFSPFLISFSFCCCWTWFESKPTAENYYWAGWLSLQIENQTIRLSIIEEKTAQHIERRYVRLELCKETVKLSVQCLVWMRIVRRGRKRTIKKERSGLIFICEAHKLESSELYVRSSRCTRVVVIFAWIVLVREVNRVDWLIDY